MEQELLRQFNGDIHTRDAVKAYFEAHIAQYALEKMFDRKDVSGIADAKDILEKAFNQLEIDYGVPQKTQTPTNNAR